MNDLVKRLRETASGVGFPTREMLREAATALEARLAEEWRPIETAPVGQDILVGRWQDGKWLQSVYTIRDEWWREDWEDEPTQWRPLPAAPSAIPASPEPASGEGKTEEEIADAMIETFRAGLDDDNALASSTPVPVGEPVAYRYRYRYANGKPSRWTYTMAKWESSPEQNGQAAIEAEPLFTAPVPAPSDGMAEALREARTFLGELTATGTLLQEIIALRAKIDAALSTKGEALSEFELDHLIEMATIGETTAVDAISRVLVLNRDTKDVASLHNLVAGLLRKLLDKGTAPSVSDELVKLAEHPNWELSFSHDADEHGPGWRVHQVNGGVNDREWTQLSAGSTPAEAIRTALSRIPSASGSAE